MCSLMAGSVMGFRDSKSHKAGDWKQAGHRQVLSLSPSSKAGECCKLMVLEAGFFPLCDCVDVLTSQGAPGKQGTRHLSFVSSHPPSLPSMSRMLG